MGVVVQQVFEQGATIDAQVIVDCLLTVLNGDVIQFDVVDSLGNLGLQTLLIGAEKLPDVGVGQGVFVGLGLFETAAGISTEVVAFHFLEAAGHLLESLVFQHFLHEGFASSLYSASISGSRSSAGKSSCTFSAISRLAIDKKSPALERSMLVDSL